jgi:hypothetical protein
MKKTEVEGGGVLGSTTDSEVVAKSPLAIHSVAREAEHELEAAQVSTPRSLLPSTSAQACTGILSRGIGDGAGLGAPSSYGCRSNAPVRGFAADSALSRLADSRFAVHLAWSAIIDLVVGAVVLERALAQTLVIVPPRPFSVSTDVVSARVAIIAVAVVDALVE